jgi:hypothetical protein
LGLKCAIIVCDGFSRRAPLGKVHPKGLKHYGGSAHRFDLIPKGKKRPLGIKSLIGF